MSGIKDKAVVKIFQNFFQLSTEPLYVEPQQPAPNLVESHISQKPIPPKKKNTFSTLFNALAVVNQDGIIKVNTGLYNQNIELKIGGLKIQSSEPTSNALMISEQRPTLIVDLPKKEDRIQIEGLKMAHICEHSKNMIRWPSLKTIRDNCYRPYKVQDNINTSILIKRGTLQIDQCRLSLAALKDVRHLYASIIVQEEGSLIITRSELVGNLGSIGIYCDGGRVNIRECSFREHGGMGVWMNGGPNSSLILKNSIMKNCGEGLVLNGPFSSSVQNNVMTDCKGYGIVTLFGNSSNIINNEIKQCKVGIQIENSCPKVMKNNLIDNIEYGICSYSKMNQQCWPLIRFNLLAENKKGGLLIWGSRNNSQVCNNVLQLNQKVGIKIESNSHPHIFLNQISATFGNGVHISGGATAFLQKNQIHGSVNSNLVLQGPRNIDNYIYSNHIHGARGNGLFLLHCQKFLVAKNNIHNNYNGILCVTSVINLQDNIISQNKSNGIMLIEDCQVIMNENIIQKNRVTGLVCRKTSRARMKSNRFNNNRIEIVVQSAWSGFNQIQKDNQFDQKADIRIPNQMTCQLI